MAYIFFIGYPDDQSSELGEAGLSVYLVEYYWCAASIYSHLTT